jgi:hypothetical protein
MVGQTSHGLRQHQTEALLLLTIFSIGLLVQHHSQTMQTQTALPHRFLLPESMEPLMSLGFMR